MEELKKHEELTMTRYGSLDYGFVWFNLRDPKRPARPHPVFGDVGVRRALSMAVDREKAVKNVLGDLGTCWSVRSRVHTFSGDTALKTIGYDPEGAKRLLDSLGWRDVNGDGTREKGGPSNCNSPSQRRRRVRTECGFRSCYRRCSGTWALA